MKGAKKEDEEEKGKKLMVGMMERQRLLLSHFSFVQSESSFACHISSHHVSRHHIVNFI